MSHFQIDFARPWLLLLLIPALALTLIPFFRLAKKFRRTRNRVISVVTHALAVTLCVLLVAGISFSYELPNKNNELLVLVDVSDSGSESAESRDDFVRTVIDACDKNYKVGVITFGYDTVYAAPLSSNTRDTYRQYLSADKPDASATDIASAVRFASEQFSNPKTAKILILSDGFETDGEALSAVKLAAASGIKVDTVEFPNAAHPEIQIVDAKMPEDKIVVGQEVKITLTVETNLRAEETVTVNVSDMGYHSSSNQITLKNGIQTVEIPHVFQSAGVHDLRFDLETVTGSDTVADNNLYHSYINIPVLEHILVLENIRGEADTLASILGEDHEVTVVNIHTDPDLIPKDARELSAYEEVVLVNLSNADLCGADMPENFVESLYDYVYNLGGGLFTAGGKNDLAPDGVTPIPHAYNRTDMADSLFQQMLPVQVIDYTPPVAVMIVVDASGSMSSGRYEAALKAAEGILNTLTDRDYCGVMTFSTSATEEISVMPVSQRDRILDTIRALAGNQDSGGAAGQGGTVFSGAIDRAGRALAPIPVERRHIVLVTDGNPSDPLEKTDNPDQEYYGKYISYNYNQNSTTMSVFAVGMTSGSREDLKKAVTMGHGNFYDIPLSDLDRITTCAREDLVEVTLSEICDNIEFTPKIKDQTSVFAGMDSTMKIPVLRGYYGTKAKDGAKVPLIYDYVPIYAEWDFGAGRVGSFLSDLGGAWSRDFVTDPVGVQLIKNIAESLAPDDTIEADRLNLILKTNKDNYTTRLDVFTQLAEGVSVLVTVKPLTDTAMDFYGGDVPVTPVGDNVGFGFHIMRGGLYRILVEKKDAAGNTVAERTVYETFSYSEEYDAFRAADEGTLLLRSLAGGGNGEVITDPVEAYASFAKTYAKTTDPRMVFLIIAIVCVLLDIAVRKFKFKWPHEILRDRRELKQLAGERSDAENTGKGGKTE